MSNICPVRAKREILIILKSPFCYQMRYLATPDQIMSFVGRIQCDQMVRLLFQYLAIYNNIEIFPNGIRNLSEYAQNFAKYLVDPLKFAKVV